MTLVLVAMNSEYAVQLSDRRLSVGGRVVDDESNKALLVHAVDGRLVVGFTGLAKAGSFETTTFLTDVLMKACLPDFNVATIASQFTDAANRAFRQVRLAPPANPLDSGLTISIAGFGPSKHHAGPTPGCLIVSNVDTSHDPPVLGDFEVVRNFVLKADADVAETSFIHPIGATGSVNDATVRPLRGLLDEKRPAVAIVGKGVELLREWSQLKPAAGTIGDQISSIIVPSDISQGWIFDYHTAVPRATIHHPIFIDATGRSEPFAFRLDIKQQDGPMVVPKVGRNHPCPCGSGIKYKRCHGSRAGVSPGELIGG